MTAYCKAENIVNAPWSMAADTSAAGEQALWRAVLQRTIDDAQGLVDGTDLREISLARHWLFRAGEDFQLVCDNAGLDPQAVQAHLRAAGVISDPAASEAEDLAARDAAVLALLESAAAQGLPCPSVNVLGVHWVGLGGASHALDRLVRQGKIAVKSGGGGPVKGGKKYRAVTILSSGRETARP